MYTERVQDGREGPSISNTNYSSDYKHSPWKRMLHIPNAAIIEAFKTFAAARSICECYMYLCII